ncbi:hypothetical protein MHYP_G00106070 [Metynnis hypsauchen]
MLPLHSASQSKLGLHRATTQTAGGAVMTDRRLDQSGSPSELKGRGFIRLQLSTDPAPTSATSPAHQAPTSFTSHRQDCVLQGKENKMSSVKEECEDIGVMEATGLKTEDQQMDKERILYKEIKEEHKPELRTDPDSAGLCGKESKMSSVKEECEDIGVMEATGLKTEDQQMDKDIREEHKPEVKLFQEEYDAKKPPQSTAHPKDHLRIHTGEDPSQRGKSLSSERALGRRMEMHDGQRPYQCSQSTPASPVWKREGRERKMSSLKEECEDVSVMEATGLKTEDQQMDEDLTCEDVKEDTKPDVMGEEPSTQPLHQDAQHGSSFSDAFLLKDQLRIHTGDGPFACLLCGSLLFVELTQVFFLKHRTVKSIQDSSEKTEMHFSLSAPHSSPAGGSGAPNNWVVQLH